MGGDDGDSSHSDATSQQEEDWDDWGASGEDADDDKAQSLFDNTVFPSIEQALTHDATVHQFDLAAYHAQVQCDEYDTIRLVNYIRSAVAAGTDPRPVLQTYAQQEKGGTTPPWADDIYLKPVLADDALLFYDYGCTVDAGTDNTQDDGPSTLQAADASAVMAQLAQVQHENEQLRHVLAALRAFTLDDAVLQALSEEEEEEEAGPSSSHAGPHSHAVPRSSQGEPSSSQQHQGEEKGHEEKYQQGKDLRKKHQQAAAAGCSRQSTAKDTDAMRVDKLYFDSYSRLQMHYEMLADHPRTEAYRQALEGNPGLLQGATVLDVGCGSGILSMFAARAGATHVVGVDGSAAIAACALDIVQANNLSKHQAGPITIVHGRLEQLGHAQLQLQGPVDVLVSEWMGYGLLFETMLDSVLAARDRFVRQGGAVLPDMATMYLAAATVPVPHDAFWNDVYGFNMRSIGDKVAQRWRQRATVVRIDATQLVTDTCTLKQFDLMTMKTSDADFTSSCELHVHKNTEITALCVWFDVEFSARFCANPVTLSTAPGDPPTHWEQLVLPLKHPLQVQSKDIVKCQLSMARGTQHRTLDIAAQVQVGAQPVQIMSFQMGVDDEE